MLGIGPGGRGGWAAVSGWVVGVLGYVVLIIK